MSQNVRRGLLRYRYGFQCNWDVCTRDPAAIVRSDARRQEICSIMSALNGHTIPDLSIHNLGIEDGDSSRLVQPPVVRVLRASEQTIQSLGDELYARRKLVSLLTERNMLEVLLQELQNLAKAETMARIYSKLDSLRYEKIQS